MEDHIVTGFLYGLWNDKLIVKEGTVLRNRWCSRREAIFQYGKRDGDWNKCSPDPGVLLCAKLWLPERDDNLARKLLIEYYKETIDRLRKQIDNHEERIKILQDA